MATYYITNGYRYVSCSNEAGIVTTGLVGNAKHFKLNNALETLNDLRSLTDDKQRWCVQKFFYSKHGSDYVVTNADRFVGSRDAVVEDVQKARPFKTVEEARAYAQEHLELPIKMRRVIVVNELYEPVDESGQKLSMQANLNKFCRNKDAVIRKAPRISIPKSTRLKIYKRDGGTCQICGKPLTPTNFTIDHIIPLERGGQNVESNYRCACKRCNDFMKNDRLDSEVAQMITEVGGNFVFKHPDSDMATAFVRMMVRGRISALGISSD